MTTIEEHRATRAEFAHRAIAGYGACGAHEPADAIQDLITDLLHLSDQRGRDALETLKAAIGNWSAENANPDDPGDANHVEIKIHGPA
jgi:hypothetical protein